MTQQSQQEIINAILANLNNRYVHSIVKLMNGQILNVIITGETEDFILGYTDKDIVNIKGSLIDKGEIDNVHNPY